MCFWCYSVSGENLKKILPKCKNVEVWWSSLWNQNCVIVRWFFVMNMMFCFIVPSLMLWYMFWNKEVKMLLWTVNINKYMLMSFMYRLLFFWKQCRKHSDITMTIFFIFFYRRIMFISCLKFNSGAYNRMYFDRQIAIM